MSNKKKQKLDYIIDATNVCSWHKVNINNQSKGADYTTSINVVLKLASILHERKKVFKCIFDANTPWRLTELEQDVYKQMLQVFEEYFYQVTGGQIADSWVLALADKFNAQVISNDRFRDYQKDYKWLEVEDDRLVKGGLMDMPEGTQLCLPNIKVIETIEEDTNTLFTNLAKQMGLNDKISVKGSGKIKFYSIEKEYGFLYNDDNNDELYFSKNDIIITEDILVDFEIFNDNGKKMARRVMPKPNNELKEYYDKKLEQANSKAKKRTQDKDSSHKKTNTNTTKIDLRSGEINWFNEEKGLGLINELNSKNTYMFKKDSIQDKDFEPKSKLKVQFETFTKGEKVFATNLQAYKENKEVAEIRIQFEDYKQKLANEMPKLCIKLKGIIREIKTKSGFINVAGKQVSLYFKVEDQSKLKEGDNVVFSIGLNDYGFYAFDVKEDTNTKDVDRKAKVKTEKSTKNTNKNGAKVKANEATEQKVVDESTAKKAKETVIVEAKEEKQQETIKEKIAEIDAPVDEQISTPKVAEVAPKAEKKTPQKPKRKGPAQLAAEKLDAANGLDVLPGEKLSALAQLEAQEATEEPIAAAETEEIDTTTAVTEAVATEVEISEAKDTSPEKAVDIDTSIEEKLAKIEAEKAKIAAKAKGRKKPTKEEKPQAEETTAEVQTEEVSATPAKQKKGRKKAVATTSKDAAKVEDTETPVAEANISEVVDTSVEDKLAKIEAEKEKVTAKKTTKRKNTQKTTKSTEEVAKEDTEVEETTEKVEKAKPIAKTATKAKPKATRTRKTAAQKKAEAEEAEKTTPSKRRRATTAAKKNTARKTSGATKKAIATKPRKATSRPAKTANSKAIEKGLKDLEIPFIVMPEKNEDKND